MSTERKGMRLPLLACALLVSLVSACSNATGPQSDARAGYITNSGTVNANSATAVSGLPAKTDSLQRRTMSAGYNVPAF